mmetsp:Transcript_59891/g.82248  ORF Transcript_59891/g.82248 Transcript_59891/m.82248 type:complete len:87 (+) Transcript_59891:74-334(+)
MTGALWLEKSRAARSRRRRTDAATGRPLLPAGQLEPGSESDAGVARRAECYGRLCAHPLYFMHRVFLFVRGRLFSPARGGALQKKL